MKYTKSERIDIGRQVHTHELSHKEAMEKYGVSESTVDGYVHDYRQANGISIKIPVHKRNEGLPLKTFSNPDIEAYMAMSKEELINELILAKANELRAKKGYEVKGVGASKEFVSLSSKNMK